MNKLIIEVISYSVIIPAVISITRLRKINKTYHSFLIFLWLGVINEGISSLEISHGKTNALNNNIFYLVESLLIAHQFKKWNLFQKPVIAFSLLSTFFLLSWCTEVFLFRGRAVFASYFIVIHSFVVVLMSISMINEIIAKEKRTLLKNPVFLICIGFIIFFTYAVLVEAFYIYGVSSSLQFQKAIVAIMALLNLFTNLLYTLSVLWMPKKQGFSLSY